MSCLHVGGLLAMPVVPTFSSYKVLTGVLF
jgi:hypothetical protein